MPDIVKLSCDKFRTRDDIIALVEKGDAPPVIQGIPMETDQNNSLASPSAEVMIFNTTV